MRADQDLFSRTVFYNPINEPPLTITDQAKEDKQYGNGRFQLISKFLQKGGHNLFYYEFLTILPLTGCIGMIRFSRHSGIYTLVIMQELEMGLPEAWDFFSTPINLEKITPPHMGFKITSGVAEQMYPGQIISYKVFPIPGIRTNWVTEITHVEPGRFFVDEQRFGPYRMWHHEHHFKETEKGVLVTDKVSYKIPFGLLGRLAQFLLVKRQLNNIFEYRIQKLEEKFNRE